MSAKVLFIGLDGLGMAEIETAMSNGEAPNIAKISSHRAHVKLPTDTGLGDGALWTSMACGVDTSHHGVYFIMQFNTETYEFDWVNETRDNHVTPFWEQLDQEGKKLFVMDWPRAPFSKLQNGVFVENFRQHDSTGDPQSYPPHIVDGWNEKHGADPFLPGLHVHPIETLEKAQWVTNTCHERIAQKTDACRSELTGKDWDLFSVVFSEGHDIGHNAYHLTDTEHALYDGEIAAAVGNPILSVTAALDQAVGELVEAAGPDCEILLMAGLGMQRLISANTAIEQITKRLDCGIEQETQPIETARKSYRALIPLPIRQMLSPLKRMIFNEENIPELAHRRFFPLLHVDNAASIRINLKGREKYGRVEPGEEYDRVLKEISEGFQEITNPDTGRSIVKDIVITRDRYDGPNAHLMPDIVIDWDRSESFTHVHSPKIGTIELPHRPVRTGDHIDEADFWANGQTLERLGLATQCRPKDVSTVISKLMN